MEFLKENAEYFEKRAIEALKEKPRFVLFFAEQAIQLYIKYILAKELDDYPKSHRLKVLLEELSKISEEARDFYERFADYMDLFRGGLHNCKIPREGVQHEKCRKCLESS